MDIQKEAEQLREELTYLEFNKNKTIDAKWDGMIGIILQSFERICREQREKCSDAINDGEDHFSWWYPAEIMDTSLLTDKSTK